jgi:hypothetical protein
MSEQSDEHPAQATTPGETFGEGQENAAEHPQDDEVGSFDDGQAEHDHGEGHEHLGRFSEGEEQLGEDDPAKHREGTFADHDE